MDTYQPIYDAVRSKLSGGDIDQSIQAAINNMNLTHYVQQAVFAYEEVTYEQMRPCVLLKPKLSIDGDKWCALYGENIQDGICGFGQSPSDAMTDFDKSYGTKLPKAKELK